MAKATCPFPLCLLRLPTQPLAADNPPLAGPRPESLQHTLTRGKNSPRGECESEEGTTPAPSTSPRAGWEWPRRSKA